MPELADLAGRCLMIGLAGPELTDDDVRVFRETRAGGLILYRRNFRDPMQLARLLDGLEAALGRRLLVATDHEGGRVVMLGQGTTIFPDNLAVGTGGNEAAARRQGLIEARELRRLGVDLNLGPVVDVLTDRYSPNIGIRSYGCDPALVGRLGAARVRGMASGGLLACPKHFPGKGHAPLDAHLALPLIPSTREEMARGHLPPFAAAIEAGAASVMTSHPVYPGLDPSGVPATFSRPIVAGLLRGELGFRGAIVSDDLEMGAVSAVASVGEAAVRATEAGHDLLLVCHTPGAQAEAALALVDACRTRRLDPAALETAGERVRALVPADRPRRTAGPAEPERDGATLARAIAAQAVATLAPGPAGLRRRLNGRVAAVVPRFADLADRVTIEPELLDAAAWCARAFGQGGVTPDTCLVGIEPTAGDITRAASAAAAADVAVLFLFDAHLYPGCRALLDAVAAAARGRLAVVLLRDPWDAALLPRDALAVTAWGFRRCQLEAAVARLVDRG